MTTLKDLKKKLEEAQSSVASLEKKIAAKTPRIKLEATMVMYRNDEMCSAVWKWVNKYPSDVRGTAKYRTCIDCFDETEINMVAIVTPDMLRSLADMMEENV